MAEVKWDKDGNIENLSELSVEEVDAAYKVKNREIFTRATTAEQKEKAASDLAEQRQRDLEELKKSSSNQADDTKVTELASQVEVLSLAERKRQFGHEHGLSPAETDAVFKVNPKPTAEDLKDPFIAGGVKAIRDKERQAKNTPGASNTSPLYGGKKWEELTPAEKKAHWPEHFAASKPQK